MKRAFALFLTLLTPLCCNAALVYLVGVPSAWRIQNFVPGSVVVYFSGSACGSGMLTLSSTASSSDVNRLYATLVAAKNMGTKVFIYYDNSDPNCYISSFGAPEQ